MVSVQFCAKGNDVIMEPNLDIGPGYVLNIGEDTLVSPSISRELGFLQINGTQNGQHVSYDITAKDSLMQVYCGHRDMLQHKLSMIVIPPKCFRTFTL